MHRALVADGTAIPVRRRGRRVGLGRSGPVAWNAEERPTPVETRVPIAIAEESGMPDAHKARRQHMEQEPAEELLTVERQDFGAVVIGVVAVPEADDAVDEIDEPVRADRHPVCVASQVGEHMIRTAERGLRVDDPVWRAQRREEVRKRRGAGQRDGAAGEGELVRDVGAPEAVEALGAKHHRERPNGKEKRRAAGNPSGPVRAEGAAGHHAMQMDMLRQGLPPRVENRRDADRATEMARIASKGQQRLGRGAKEHVVDDAGIALGQGVEDMREREDDVELRDGEQPRRAASQRAVAFV